MTGGGSCPIKPSRQESDGTRRGLSEGPAGSLPWVGLFRVLDGPGVTECLKGRFFGRFSRVLKLLIDHRWRLLLCLPLSFSFVFLAIVWYSSYFLLVNLWSCYCEGLMFYSLTILNFSIVTKSYFESRSSPCFIPSPFELNFSSFISYLWAYLIYSIPNTSRFRHYYVSYFSQCCAMVKTVWSINYSLVKRLHELSQGNSLTQTATTGQPACIE